MFGGFRPRGGGALFAGRPLLGGWGVSRPGASHFFRQPMPEGVEGFRPSEGESLFPRRKSDQNAA